MRWGGIKERESAEHPSTKSLFLAPWELRWPARRWKYIFIKFHLAQISFYQNFIQKTKLFGNFATCLALQVATRCDDDPDFQLFYEKIFMAIVYGRWTNINQYRESFYNKKKKTKSESNEKNLWSV